MSELADLDFVRRKAALQVLATARREDMKRRWPKIDFDADIWPIKSLYNTRMSDVRFGRSNAHFKGWDSSYLLALRCSVASIALEGKIINSEAMISSWCMIPKHITSSVPLATLGRHHLQDIESKSLAAVTAASSSGLTTKLTRLAAHLDYLAKHGVIERFMWSASVKTKTELAKLRNKAQKEFKQRKSEVLDQQIEALSEATSAMLKNDDRLDRIDCSIIALMNILMCAPSRINEPMNCKIGDRFTFEDYTTRSEDRESSTLHQVHMMLLMKGSKGAAWAPKPILNFMLALIEECWQILIDGSKRSRMLLTWYEQNPDKLYLPSELEHIRGKPISRISLWQIVNLTSEKPTKLQLGSIYANYWNPLVKPDKGTPPVEILKIAHPRAFDARGNEQGDINALPWDAVEELLLKKLHERMVNIRKVTVHNHYKGPLSQMLVLVDPYYTPFLPQALNLQLVNLRLHPSTGIKRTSIFAKLGLRMSQGGKEVDCYINTHDPRRWLTTQALAAKERLSDVLINKWANRLSLGQLQSYDLRSDEQKAEQAAMPLPNELEDMSKGLQDLDDQASRYGLASEVLVAHGQGVSVTSMDAVFEATEDRPVARTGGQILILYPTRFGACVHQHHETPCRSYICGPCNENATVKGHLPTNEEWHKEEHLTYRSIVNQLQALLTARNRGIADDPTMLDAHLLTLVKEGLNSYRMADELIERFQEIKDQIHELSFRNALEQAFVAHGVVQRLNDPKVPSGALIKYHNPKRHAAPGHELAIEAHFGSRDEMDRQSELFYQQHPELAPANLGLRDESMQTDDNDEPGHNEAA